MTSIGSLSSVYTPPAPTVSAPAPTPDVQAAAAQATPTNANDTAPAIYTSAANESTSNIRGTSLNISA